MPVGETKKRSDSTNSATRKQVAPRLFCDICDVWDQHDTEDCPQQSSLAAELQQERSAHSVTTSLAAADALHSFKPTNRAYCDRCEEFGHEEDACPQKSLTSNTSRALKRDGSDEEF